MMNYIAANGFCMVREESPSEAAIDSQSVKSAAMLDTDIGFDGGKKIKGRKRFISVDTLGLMLRVLGHRCEHHRTGPGANKCLRRPKRWASQVSRLQIIWADGGFSGPEFMMWVMDMCRWVVQVVLRPKQTKGFVVLKKRWVVETYIWLVDALSSFGA